MNSTPRESPEGGAVTVNGEIVSPPRSDAPALGRTIATAFHPLDASGYLEPDPRIRAEHYPAYFECAVLDTMDQGTAYAIGTDAVALWMPVAAEGLAPAELDQRLVAIDEGLAQRDLVFHEILHERHPTDLGGYQWLMILGVHPDLQGRGLGSSLLDAHHAHLDEEGLAAYLEAASEAARRLYLRHGYTDAPGGAIELPDGALMFPMIRRPRTP